MNQVKNWVELNLFDLCQPKQWKTISVKNLTETGYVVYGANGKIGYYSTYTHEKPTVMITCRGASCGNIHISEPFAYINGNAMALDELSSNINLKFLYYYLSSRDFNDVISGSAQPQITQEGMKVINVPLPPLNEQKCIAKKLDELLVTVESIKTRLDNAPTILKRFRQSILAAATSGKLTEEWRKENPININLELKKLEEYKQNAIKNKSIKKDLIFSLSDSDINIPNNWAMVTLGSLAEKITDGEHKTPKREESGKYLLSARNIRDGFISLDKVDYVGEEEFSKLRKRCNPDKGDILISCSGSVGRIALVDRSDEYVMVRSAALVKTGYMQQNNKYLMYLLQSPLLQDEIRDKSKATAQANLFLGPIKELPIPYPPQKEQKEIVSQVESLFALVDSMEAKIEAAQKHVDKLTQSILAKAFRGELVEQDPNDEPAVKLLERIRVEQESVKVKKTRGKKG